MSALHEFYTGTGKDAAGRTITQVRNFSYKEMEEVHDYIQWLFPLTETSQFNPDAPILTADDVKAISAYLILHSFERMLAFYGLRMNRSNQGPSVVKIEKESFDDDVAALLGERLNADDLQTFEDRRKVWVTPNNHNYLRITRILKCLCLFGRRREAELFLEQLIQIYSENASIMGTEPFSYWTAAITETPSLVEKGHEF